MTRTFAPAHGERLLVGNCSGFYGDRLSAMTEMLTGGPLDVLTGDYLAELTMLILAKDRVKDPAAGQARTFARQFTQNLQTIAERHVAVVVNAGGLNPRGLAADLRKLINDHDLDLPVAAVYGDDLADRFEGALAANAYLGAFGIAEALNSGARVVVTGRVTDASVVIGPAIAAFGWGREDLDQLAGATIAGHVIECGAQATGGNFAFFDEIPDLLHPGLPIAEIGADGSSVITKHPGTGGAVTPETVTAQLLYEIQDARYAGPDVTTRLDSIALSTDGPDRVMIHPVIGEAPPPTLKVSVNRIGGYRNEMAMILTGPRIEAKAELVRRQIEHGLSALPAELTWRLERTDSEHPRTEAEASATLVMTGRDADESLVGRALTGAVIELALSSYPGFHTSTPPGPARPYGVFTPEYVPQSEVEHLVELADGSTLSIDPPTHTLELAPCGSVISPPGAADDRPAAAPPAGARLLGEFLGARSGDKGGNANLGVWARDDSGWQWLQTQLTSERLRSLCPEFADLQIMRTELPRLRAVNFVIFGLLGEGVAYGARFDSQAKALGEWVRAIPVPVAAGESATEDTAPTGDDR